MAVLGPVAGGALVLAMLFDIAVTTLDPSRRGPLSHRGNLVLWRMLRRAGVGRFAPPLRAIGPLTVVANFAIWAAGLWCGFALIYLPYMHEFRGAAGSSALEALYVSGTSLSTLGFGDIVATSDVLRIVTTIEAACGLTAITAAITYLLSSYGVTSEMRTAAARMSDLDAASPAGAAQLVIHGGTAAVLDLQRELIATQQHLRHFPVLFYFHRGDERESLLVLLRSAALVCLVLRWGVDAGAVPHAEPYGHGLERSLRVLMSELHDEFDLALADHDDVDARAELARLRDAVRTIDPRAARSGDPGDDFAGLLRDAERTLGELARVHGHGPRALVADFHAR